MNEWLKEYFTFTRKEQRGLAILLGLMLLTLAFNILAPNLVKNEEYDISAFKAQVEKFLADTLATPDENAVALISKSDAHTGTAGEPGFDFKSQPFAFDPNTLGEADWKRTGLDDRIIRNIIRYRQKGGVFRTREDFRKIYGITDSMFNLLEPYIILQNKPLAENGLLEKNSDKEKDGFIPVKSFEDKVLQIELNSADSADLTGLPGIGPSFASRIVRYRQMLGGFVNPEQLMEIKGMDSARYEGIRNFITADVSLVRKMDINSVTFKQMMKHPYFEYYLVKIIFNYRDKIKAYDSIEQLRNVENIYPELYVRIAPYLEVSPPKKE